MSLTACKEVNGSFDVQNIGKVTGDEVAQIYMSFMVYSLLTVIIHKLIQCS